MHQLIVVTHSRGPDGSTVHIAAGDVLPLHHDQNLDDSTSSRVELSTC